MVEAKSNIRVWLPKPYTAKLVAIMQAIDEFKNGVSDMGQWGKERTFTRGKTTIRVLEHWDTGNAFSPIGPDSKFERYILLDIDGDCELGRQLFEEVNHGRAGL